MLLMAIRLESNFQSLTLSNSVDESTLEDICSNLVVLDPQLKVWKFPHASVAEYFECHHESWMDKAREDVAVLLVSCLNDCYSEWKLPESHEKLQNFLRMTPDLDNHLDPRHPLQVYVRLYWLWHVQNTPNQRQEATRLSKSLKQFLGAQGLQYPSSRQYQAWCRHMIDSPHLGYSFSYDDDVQPSEKSIFGICALGLQNLIKDWWNEKIDVSQANINGLDLLAIAAKYGHAELCSELLDRGSDIHKGLDSGRGSAFMEAIHSQQINTARLLLDKGVDPNLIRKGTTPLCMAVRLAEDLVEPLLEAGADPNITCSVCVFDCVLEVAACEDKVHSAGLLIKFGANISLVVEKNGYGSPLGTAAYWGSLQCVKLFIQNGADVNAYLSGWYGGVLAAAICGGGKVEMIKYLIEEAGADPAVLSLSPPQPPFFFLAGRTERRAIAKYLIDGAHIQESFLLDIGFSREELPEMEGEVATESEDE
jgi:ankyrin repeat protein